VRKPAPRVSLYEQRAENGLRASNAPFGAHRRGSACLRHGHRRQTSFLGPTLAAPPAHDAYVSHPRWNLELDRNSYISFRSCKAKERPARSAIRHQFVLERLLNQHGIFAYSTLFRCDPQERRALVGSHPWAYISALKDGGLRSSKAKWTRRWPGTRDGDNGSDSTCLRKSGDAPPVLLISALALSSSSGFVKRLDEINLGGAPKGNRR